MLGLGTNRVLDMIEKRRATLASGKKPDGTPITADLVAFEATMDNTFSEHFAYQNLQAEAHARGWLTTDEAQTVYAALGDPPAANGWSSDADLATKVVITSLMGELVARKAR